LIEAGRGVMSCTQEHDGCSAEAGSLRCDCGSLLARLVDAGVELKCRRCKRLVVVPLAGDVRLEEPHRES